MTENPMAIRQIQALMIAYQNLVTEIVQESLLQGASHQSMLSFVSRLIAANERTIPPEDGQFAAEPLLVLQGGLLDHVRENIPPQSGS